MLCYKSFVDTLYNCLYHVYAPICIFVKGILFIWYNNDWCRILYLFLKKKYNKATYCYIIMKHIYTSNKPIYNAGMRKYVVVDFSYFWEIRPMHQFLYGISYDSDLWIKDLCWMCSCSLPNHVICIIRKNNKFVHLIIFCTFEIIVF